MRTLLSVGMALSLVTVMGLSASAGTPVAGGGLFLESNESASSKLTIDGELRTRWENQNNMLDTSSANHDHLEYVDARMRLGLLFELAENTSVKVTLQSRYLWGGQAGYNDAEDGAAGVEDRDSLDVYEAYVQMKPTIFRFETTLTIGRQPLVFGNEMLLGDDTKYAGLTHDAVRLDLNPIENLDTAIFVAKVVENSAQFGTNSSELAANAGVSNDTHLFGIYNTYHVSEDVLFDVYLLYLAEDDETGAGTFSLYGVDAKIFTGGARVAFNKLELFGQKFDFGFEVAAQIGEVNMGAEDLDIQDAFAFETELGWSPELPWSPRFALGLAWASGDEDGTDGAFNTFIPAFQDTQGRLGKADVFQLQNIRCWYLAATCNPMESEKVTAGVAYYKFNAFEEGDGLGAGGVDAFTGSNVNDMADEIDMFVGYKVSDNADLKLCWSWIEPDDMIHDAAGFSNSPAHRVHLSLIVKF